MACLLEKEICVPTEAFTRHQTRQLLINKAHRCDFDEILSTSHEILHDVSVKSEFYERHRRETISNMISIKLTIVLISCERLQTIVWHIIERRVYFWFKFQKDYALIYDQQGVNCDFHVAHNDYLIELSGINSLLSKYQYHTLPQLLQVRKSIALTIIISFDEH
jgi:hypothetical protein